MKFLRLKDVIEKTGLSKSAIYSKIKEREFPASVPIGSRTVAWLEADVEQWLEWRVQVRDRAAKGYFN
ncbi:AlpA family transcriptional regulator [Vibrio parahaemolyticus]|uniref:AlpA family transcriptional regulator n=1 Tax=Vibrio parahaemolyticus TaxID=670 RepID=UPI0004D70138|nr:AlpA family transcriptional regulator [Vibrio parahaemolyticus]EJG0618029.1 AlpA family transcriptional regulator [Vibrio parahaemolyticus]EJG0636251.1 AlpA family transcriptional regulator [Vibrio parahaemolyticus]EJG0685593.1 AlpA family transcriptional regulator [Vibrio parahaemolyticus]EJG0698992.1 AlpA family transcriptional regulator [Vibrio parahaemolyticus]EJG0726301.1 AlpA family transcriptional regulator [Vibrio parahaemolyticus]